MKNLADNTCAVCNATCKSARGLNTHLTKSGHSGLHPHLLPRPINSISVVIMSRRRN